MSIPLPPVPLLSIDTWPNTPEKLRARDQEIVSAVLEAAAKKFLPTQGYFGRDVQEIIRALEFRHVE